MFNLPLDYDFLALDLDDVFLTTTGVTTMRFSVNLVSEFIKA